MDLVASAANSLASLASRDLAEQLIVNYSQRSTFSVRSTEYVVSVLGKWFVDLFTIINNMDSAYGPGRGSAAAVSTVSHIPLYTSSRVGPIPTSRGNHGSSS